MHGYNRSMNEVIYLTAEHEERDWPKKLWREALGETFREVRHERGERLSDVARRAGISPQYLSELERGQKDPSSENLHAISGALGLATSDVTRRAADRIECANRHNIAVLAA